MNWNPNQFGQNPAPNMSQPQPGPGGFGQPAQPPGGFAPQAPVQAPQGYPAGYNPGGYTGPQQSAAPVAQQFQFQPVAPKLDKKDDSIPYGQHVLVATGEIDYVGTARDLFLVKFYIETSDSQPPNTPCSFKRKLTGTHVATAQMVSDALGQLAVPLSGRDPKTCPSQDALRLTAELLKGQLDGASFAGKKVGVISKPSKKLDRNGVPYADLTFVKL
jgi:hypothetical protein